MASSVTCKPALPDVQATEVYPAEDVVTTDYHAEICDEEILTEQSTLAHCSRSIHTST